VNYCYLKNRFPRRFRQLSQIHLVRVLGNRRRRHLKP
jgi:hypothetical protein